MQNVNLFDQIAKNRRNSILLSFFVILVLFALIYFIGVIFYPEFTIFIIVFAILIVITHIYTSYMYGDKIVLSSTNARPVEEGNPKYVHLVNVVDGLSIAAGIPRPKIYVMECEEINAYATGRDPKHASIAVTTGALEKLNRQELEGVIGHELSHVRNFDIRFAMIVAVMVGLVAIVSNIFLRSSLYGGRGDRKGGGAWILLIGLLLAAVSPIIVRLVQLAISRKREYLADASSAQLTRYPDGLASALEKIKKYNEGKMKVSEAVSHIFFADPTKSGLDSLFATHPPIEKRIEILRAM